MQKNKFFATITAALLIGFWVFATSFIRQTSKFDSAKKMQYIPFSDTVRTEADSLYKLADVFRQQERWEDALRHLNWAIKRYDKEPLYFLDRGAVYIQITLPEKAITDLLYARQLDSTNAALAMRIYANLAVAENNLEHWDKSIAYSTKTLSYNKQWGFPYFIRSESYQHKGDTVQMCNDLTMALRYGVPQARERILRYCAKEVQFKP
jgi:tetratricopeptide (TPR) repeat protein